MMVKWQTSYRLVIVGCGAITREMHLPVAGRVEGVTVTALVDPDIHAAQALADSFRVRRVAVRLSDVAAEADAVIVATPPHVRPSLAEEAFHLGLDVLCEKPLANTVAECDRMVRAAEAAGKILAVGHMCRFYPVRESMPGLCERHGLGRVRRVVATEGKPYDWPTATGYTVRRDLSAGGVLINAGIHTVDSLLWWFGTPDVVDYADDAIGGLESNVRLRMGYSDGLKILFRQSRTCRLPYLIRVEAEHGNVVIPTSAVDEYLVEAGGRSVRHRCGLAPVTAEDCWVRQLSDFIQSCRSATPPRVDGTEGMRVVRLIESCYAQKHARTRPNSLPLPGLTW